ncbi:MAG TPA: hypothetical protein VLE48_11965 [Terriglobales bacterium]|nr:hypothetical protein [Terriglobales bacterium]
MTRCLIAILIFLLLPAAAQDAPTPKPVKEYNEDEPAQAQKPVKEYSESEAEVPQPTPAPAPATPVPSALTAKEQELRAIAERFAPVIYHRLAGTEEDYRFDYPTNFDFDGDWVGNNNWTNAADPRYKLWSFVYYSVIEGEDHYYLHYAVYHPRDWSVVQSTYTTILDKVQEKYGDILGNTTRKDIEFNHENDLEGALVIVAKHAEGGPAVIAMETVAHNHLLRWVTPGASYLRITSGLPRQRLRLEDGRPVLYIESQKHGIHGWQGEEATEDQPILTLRYGKPVEFSQVKDFEATYELVSLQKTWWKHGREARQPNQTFGTVVDFGDRFCAVAGARRPDCELGTVGGAIRGDYARPNAASAPWNWIDLDDESLPPGAWFFDPASILRRHFGQFDSEERYLYNPYLGITADAAEPAQATAR